MLRSRDLGRLMNPRRSPPTLGIAVGAAFAAALIGLAPAARADTEPDPFEDLLGTAGVNTWTPTADAELLSSNPTEAANLDASIDTFNNDVELAYQIDPLSQLAFEFDPSGFTQGGFTGIDSASGGLPDNAIADLAVGLDYTLWASDLTGVGSGLTDIVQIPEDIVIALLYLPLLPLILAGA
jgi:hypothetical protein